MLQYVQFFLALLFLCVSTCCPQEVLSDSFEIGNFALPPSQQPTTLFSFGQNIVDKHDFLGFEDVLIHKLCKERMIINSPGFLYGINNKTSIFIAFPTVFNKAGCLKSQGIGDIIIQGEHAYIKKEKPTNVTVATIVGSLYIPSGSAKKIIPTGYGSTSYFLGGTTFHITIDWYYFASIGNLFTTKHHGSRFGNFLRYEAGIGRNLHHFDDKILLLYLELDGIRYNRNILNGKIDHNSGNNTIYLGPSLFFSTRRYILQAGIQAPIFQKLYGPQPKSLYYVGLRFVWLFHQGNITDKYK